ncbi:MAG: FKBP-type peptidyl-prolyl cis-trans isomerase [Parabacteroides sp.]|nr:FKBP-type peptidyl-prolyl cis-trans isomerase [Parabacteroides sp.]
MKKYLHIALMLLCVLALPACGGDEVDTEAVEKEAYKLEQEIAFLEKANDPNYVKWESEAGDGYVFAKLIKKGNGKRAYFNSLVSVYYKGFFVDGKSFDAYQPEDGIPFRCSVSSYYANTYYTSVIDGWGVALQHMVEGDIYEVWIPQELGYGEIDNGDIPANSTLVFQIELISVDLQAA